MQSISSIDPAVQFARILTFQLALIYVYAQPAQITFVPTPQHIEWSKTSDGFAINANVEIATGGSGQTKRLLKSAASMLNETIRKVYGGLRLTAVDLRSATAGKIVIADLPSLGDGELKQRFSKIFDDSSRFPNRGATHEDQNYVIEVADDRILVIGKGARGAFYGVQTLIQLIQQKEGERVVGCLIEDYPDMPVRAVHVFGGHELTAEHKRRIQHFAHLKYTHVVLQTSAYFGHPQRDWRLVRQLTEKEEWQFSPEPAQWQKIKTYFDYCREYGLEPVPELQSFGHAASILAIDPHCAEASFVESQKFVFDNSQNNIARVVPINDRLLARPGVGAMMATGTAATDGKWESGSDRGGSIKLNEIDRRSGRRGIKIERAQSGTSKLWQDISCQPNTLYQAQCRIKIEDKLQNGVAYLEIYQLDNQNNHISPPWQSQTFQTTGDTWQQVDLLFNSGPYSRLRLYVRLEQGSGTVWFDDVELSATDYAMQNVVLTNSAPVTVWSPDRRRRYREQIDYLLHRGDTVWRDRFVSFHQDDKPFRLELLPRGNIRPGETILVDYNQITRLNTGNVPYCPSEPRVYQIMSQVIATTIKELQPQAILIGHDEVGQMGTDSRDLTRRPHLNNAQLFAEETNWMHDRIKRDHDIEVWMFADMLDPFLNGYELSDPTAPAIELLPKDIVMCPWFYEENWQGVLKGGNSNPYYANGKSFDFRQRTAHAVEYFAKKGFRVLGAAGHEWVRGAYMWSQEMARHRSTFGILNTSWTDAWDPQPENDTFWAGYYNWNTLPASAEFSWHSPLEFDNALKQESWPFYRHLTKSTNRALAQTNAAQERTTTDEPALLHRFNAKFGDIYVARPTGVRIVKEGGKLVLRWQPNTESDVVGYNVYSRRSGARAFDPPTFVRGRSNASLTLPVDRNGMEYIITALDQPVRDSRGFVHQNESEASEIVQH